MWMICFLLLHVYKLCTGGLIISFDCLYTCYTKSINVAFPLLSVAVSNGANTFLYLSDLLANAKRKEWAWLEAHMGWCEDPFSGGVARHRLGSSDIQTVQSNNLFIKWLDGYVPNWLSSYSILLFFFLLLLSEETTIDVDKLLIQCNCSNAFYCYSI